MIKAFEPLPTANEGTIKDRFGNPLNVGNQVLYLHRYEEGQLGEACISGYNHLYFELSSVKPDIQHGTQVGLVADKLNQWVPYQNLINVEALMDPQVVSERQDVYKTVLDFTPSENKKCSRKYAVLLVGDLHSLNNDSFNNHQVVITSVAGSTAAEWNMLNDHLLKKHKLRIISKLCGSRKGFHESPTYTTAGGTHFWDCYTASSYWSSAVTFNTQCVPQSHYQLTKRRMQEMGLLEHVDTIMSVHEYNNLVVEDAAKLEILY